MPYKLSDMYRLTKENIDEAITRKTALGVYALDRGTGAFKVYYVGRADKQPLRDRLRIM